MRRSAHSSSGTGSLARTARRPPSQGRGRALWIGGAIVLSGALLWALSGVLPTLFASAVFAWLLNPVVTRLARQGDRERAVVGVGAGLLALATLLVVVVVPAVVSQVAELSTNLKPYVDNLVPRLQPWVMQAEARFGVKIPVNLQELAAEAPQWLARISPDVRASVSEALAGAAKGGIAFVVSLLGWFLLPLFTFYLLRDWPLLLAAAEDVVPPRWRPTVLRLAAEIDARLVGFVRGQLTVALALGAWYTTGLLFAGIDLAITLGMLSGVLFLVPYLGTLVGIVLSSTLALLKFGLDWHVVACILTFVTGQLVEGTFLTPRLVGDRVGLHPMVVMVALVVGGNLLGVWGLVLGVPITAVLAVLGGEVLGRWRASRLFAG
jgi:predicted PurR-regulated permease PerM